MTEVKGVSKEFDKKEIIKNISLCINPGEIHGLIGANSEGKTTLARCITGILNPQAGEILVDGEPVYDHPIAKEKIAFVSSGYDFPQGATVKSIRRLYCNMYPDFSKDRFAKLLEVFDINQANYLSQLSTGEKMRVKIALNLSRKAKYLILDEPTLGLDVIGKRRFYQALIEYVDEWNAGVLIASHDLLDLEMICNKIHVLRHGEMIIQEDLDVLMKHFSKFRLMCNEEKLKDADWKQIFFIENESIQECVKEDKGLQELDNEIIKENELQQLTSNDKDLFYKITKTGGILQIMLNKSPKEAKQLLSSIEYESLEEIPVHLDDIFELVNQSKKEELR